VFLSELSAATIPTSQSNLGRWLEVLGAVVTSSSQEDPKRNDVKSSAPPWGAGHFRQTCGEPGAAAMPVSHAASDTGMKWIRTDCDLPLVNVVDLLSNHVD
jgi:hypothetical protein